MFPGPKVVLGGQVLYVVVRARVIFPIQSGPPDQSQTPALSILSEIRSRFDRPPTLALPTTLCRPLVASAASQSSGAAGRSLPAAEMACPVFLEVCGRADLGTGRSGGRGQLAAHPPPTGELLRHGGRSPKRAGRSPVGVQTICRMFLEARSTLSSPRGRVGLGTGRLTANWRASSTDRPVPQTSRLAAG